MLKPVLQLAAVGIVGIGLWKLAAIFLLPLLFFVVKIGLIVCLRRTSGGTPRSIRWRVPSSSIPHAAVSGRHWTALLRSQAWDRSPTRSLSGVRLLSKNRWRWKDTAVNCSVTDPPMST